MGQFGDKFRKAREKKGISLDDVSNVTKISSRMLQAIEEEHFDQLPGGVFNKGFIRAYARQVGLNDEEAVNEYLACLRQAQIDAQAVWEPNAISGRRPQVAAHQIAANKAVAGKVTHAAKSAPGPAEIVVEAEELPELQLPRIEHVRREFGNRRKPLPWRPVVIALLLLVTVDLLWQRRMRHARAEVETPLPQASQSAPVVPVSAPEPAPSRPTQASSGLTHGATATKGVVAANRLSSPPNPGIPANTKPANAERASDEDNSVSAPELSSVSAAKTSARFRLVIHADENSWISVTADGQPVSHETLIAPADASIRANREIVARIGNVAGVSFVWNGQEIQPQGAEAEVKTFVFDESGMHEAPSAGQTPAQTH